MKLYTILPLIGYATLAMSRATDVHLHVAPVARDFNPNRLADDGTWNKFKCKGEKLVAAMEGTEAEAAKLMDLPAAQSVWEGDLKAELNTWGYTEATPSYINCDFKTYWAVESAFNALGLDTRPKAMGGPNTCYNIQHWDPNKKDDQGRPVPKAQQTYNVNGKDYRVTGAEMQIAVNTVGKVVFMQYVTSPGVSALNVWNKKPSLDELPELRHLSDIFWGLWNRENSDLGEIKYLWVQGVGNTNTKTVIARAMKEAGAQLQKWPGTTFDMVDDGAKAILGSENGACWGFFLAQHKSQLGNLVVEKIQVFKNDRDSNPDPDLLFYVESVPSE